MEKPGRPLGLSIAIIVSSMLFGLLPIGQSLFYLSLIQQFNNIEFLEDGGAVGGSITNVSIAGLLVPLVYGTIFLVISFLAWRGKPPVIRWIFMLAVVVITSYTTLTVLSAVTDRPSLDQGIDSGAAISQSLYMTRLLLSLLVTLYVLWYVNRGPARAFYRGYYLSESDD